VRFERVDFLLHGADFRLMLGLKDLARAALLALLIVAAAAAAQHRGGAPVLVLGDSLSAEYGLPRGQGWVQLLADRLARERRQYSVVNASVSGETTSGGRTRLPALLREHQPAVVIIQLGGNDGLRGLPVGAMRENLRAMIGAAQAAGARVLMVGMQMPPNYGRAYAEQFAASFGQVARETGAALVPFLLDGFAERLELFQDDRIHPAVQAQPLMLENVWRGLAALLAPPPRR
jgi:acyl-CoA thioesterase-1